MDGIANPDGPAVRGRVGRRLLGIAAALPTILLLGACGSGGDGGDAAAPPPPVSDPSPVERELLGQVLSGLPPGDPLCLAAATSAESRPQFWADSLSFGDGRLVWPGDPRFAEVAKRWHRAAPSRRDRIRLPRQGLHRDIRLVPDPGAPGCRARLLVYAPLIDGDMAFVAADRHEAPGGRPGGDIRFWIFRLRDGRWAPAAFGTASYGRPVI